MKSALITGVAGQDGSYLAEWLLKQGYQVVGTTRHVQAALNALPLPLRTRVTLAQWDLTSKADFRGILSQHRPREIYNCAAYSSGAGMYDDPVSIGQINGLAVTVMLEAICEMDPTIRFCQASSREIFGVPSDSPQSENTPAVPRSPYGAAKLYADNMVRIYREQFGLFACSAIFYNHESPRRRAEFVTRKITAEAVKIKLGLSRTLPLGNLDTIRDWGFAGDFVRAMWLMLGQATPQDYIVATGTGHTVREFCDCAFRRVGLDYRQYVVEASSAYRPSEPAPLVGNIRKAQEHLGWSPQISFHELVALMVDADAAQLTHNARSESPKS
jgi:GDPmannose 4,6-dehydratase